MVIALPALSGCRAVPRKRVLGEKHDSGHFNEPFIEMAGTSRQKNTGALVYFNIIIVPGPEKLS